jgi:hypothetical protein
MSLSNQYNEKLEEHNNDDEGDDVDVVDDDDDDDDDELLINKLKFVICQNMMEIKKGRLELLPLQCLMNQYILKKGYICYYVVVDDEETCDSFDIYEFEYTGGGEDDEYRQLESAISGTEYLEFIKDKIQGGFNIYILKS